MKSKKVSRRKRNKFMINTVQEFIDILRFLDRNGIDTSKMDDEDSFESLAKKSGVNLEFLSDMDIDPQYAIGAKKMHIVRAYQQNIGKYKKLCPTLDEKMTIELYGIDFGEAKYVRRFINKLEILLLMIPRYPLLSNM